MIAGLVLLVEIILVIMRLFNAVDSITGTMGSVHNDLDLMVVVLRSSQAR